MSIEASKYNEIAAKVGKNAIIKWFTGKIFLTACLAAFL